MEKEKVAGWYSILLFSLSFVWALILIINFFTETKTGDDSGLGAILVLGLAIILIISAFMVFVGFKIKKDITWAKITALIIFIPVALYSLMKFASVTGIIGIILSVIGIILVSFSLKSK